MDFNLLASSRPLQSARTRIYDYLYKHDTSCKRDIQEQLNLSLPTIGQNLAFLYDNGLIEKNGFISNTGGRSAAVYSIIPQARLAIGLDITSHHITAVVIDLRGIVIASLRVRHKFQINDEYMAYLGEIVNRIIEENNIDTSCILGVGIGLPGLTNDTYNEVVYGKILDIYGLTSEDFSKYIDFPVIIQNDANAACAIELYNTPESTLNAFYLMLSNNVGGALFINGTVYKGDSFRSGEIGHLNIHPGGLQCYCGQKGCVDPYCSATVLTSISNDNLAYFFELLDKNDPAAKSIWAAYLEHLALAVKNIRVLLDCPIIIGGYVGAYIDNYLDELKAILDRYNTFDQDSNYVIPCRYKTEAIAAGAALTFIKSFIASI